MPKVSIIVPVYKVEKYLHQCIDSVLSQDYTDIELILVDDGSPDQSGAICDSYAVQDKRVKVIHKENGGLSSARNAALPYVCGNFVFFLDSDDYLAPSAINHLMSLQLKTGADIVVGNYYYTYSDHETPVETPFADDSVFDNQTAMSHLAVGEIQNFAWGKLIRTEIAMKHLFPEGRLFEDHYWAHLIFADAKTTAVSSVPVLHYRQRDDSISYSINVKRLDMLDGWLCRKKFFETHYPECLQPFMEKTVVPGFLDLSWLVLTRMKSHRKAAFHRLQVFCKEQKLSEYASANNLHLIKYLTSWPFLYSVAAVFNRLKGKL